MEKKQLFLAAAAGALLAAVLAAAVTTPILKDYKAQRGALLQENKTLLSQNQALRETGQLPINNGAADKKENTGKKDREPSEGRLLPCSPNRWRRSFTPIMTVTPSAPGPS